MHSSDECVQQTESVLNLHDEVTQLQGNTQKHACDLSVKEKDMGELKSKISVLEIEFMVSYLS